MSYRPYPLKKSISYGSRHHLTTAYKAPSVRGYGSRSPFQTGSGVGSIKGVLNVSAPLTGGLEVSTENTADGKIQSVTVNLNRMVCQWNSPGSSAGEQVMTLVKDSDVLTSYPTAPLTSNQIIPDPYLNEVVLPAGVYLLSVTGNAYNSVLSPANSLFFVAYKTTGGYKALPNSMYSYCASDAAFPICFTVLLKCAVSTTITLVATNQNSSITQYTTSATYGSTVLKRNCGYLSIVQIG